MNKSRMRSFFYQIPCFLIALVTLLLPAMSLSAQNVKPQQLFRWEQLPPIPDAVRVAGPFGGVSGGELIVAGGANFPDGMPWEGVTKGWHEAVYVLPSPDGDWDRAGTLLHTLAYGVWVRTSEGLFG